MGNETSVQAPKEINDVSRQLSASDKNSKNPCLDGLEAQSIETKISATLDATVKTVVSGSSEEEADDSSVVSSDSEYDSDDDEDLDEEYEEFIAERRMILEEARMMKTAAEWFMQPEKTVTVTDPTCFGRNYFSRPDAVEQIEESMEEERDMIMNDMKMMKVTVEWYHKPEAPVEVTDSTCLGRNYFSRPDAVEFLGEDDAEEEECIMQDLEDLKQLANWYMHPEAKLEVDAAACARNYFSRASAPINEGEKERQQVLAEAAQLKKVAQWYMHPEAPVVCDDPCATGRNYFSRASAPDTAEEDLERQQVLADAMALKKVAGWYMHPEAPLEVDCTASARGYFSRFSAEEQEEDDMDDLERQQILAEMAELKQVAEWYHCPEKPVEVDPSACARNYFSRPSAPTSEEEEEGLQVLAEAAELKKVAGWYMHPEIPVMSSAAVTRNFFTRPSAPTNEDEEERQQALADMAQLKKLAVDFLHPEKPVNSSANCVRNYFNRPSAPGHVDQIHTEGQAIGQHGFLEVHHFDDHHHYHEYDYGHHHDDHSMQSDHFEMEEDQLHGFRDSMVAYQLEHDKQVPIIAEGNEKEGGNLSRSPSDVMLFDEAAM